MIKEFFNQLLAILILVLLGLLYIIFSPLILVFAIRDKIYWKKYTNEFAKYEKCPYEIEILEEKEEEE